MKDLLTRRCAFVDTRGPGSKRVRWCVAKEMSRNCELDRTVRQRVEDNDRGSLEAEVMGFRSALHALRALLRGHDPLAMETSLSGRARKAYAPCPLGSHSCHTPAHIYIIEPLCVFSNQTALGTNQTALVWTRARHCTGPSTEINLLLPRPQAWLLGGRRGAIQRDAADARRRAARQHGVRTCARLPPPGCTRVLVESLLTGLAIRPLSSQHARWRARLERTR